MGESQVEIGKGGVLTPRNESNDYFMAPAAHLALTYPSVHLAVTELGPLLGLGSREPGLQP